MKKKKTDSATAVPRCETSFKDGLTDSQVALRKESGLVNGIKEKPGKAYLAIIKNNALTMFDCILYAVTIVYICFGIWSKSVCPEIVSIPNAYIGFSKYGYLNALLGNVIIGIIQEIKAKKAVDKLKLVDRQESEVIRNGKATRILSDDIVLDDIVVFRTGNTITIDGIVLDGMCQMNESMLTGESRTVKKDVGDTVYAGTFVVSGEIRVRADKIGKDTSSGVIQSNIKAIKKKKSELMRSLNRIINIIAIVLIPVSIGTLCSLIRTQSISIDTLYATDVGSVSKILGVVTTAGSAIIGSIPTGLILLTSVTLATSVLKLAAVKTIVKDMYSVESLSRIDTICFDKTGTLTTGNQTVQEVIPLKNDKSLMGEKLSDVLACYIHALPADNPTSLAITKYYFPNSKYEILGKTFFTSDTKRTSVKMKISDSDKTFYLGAPEYLTDDQALLEKVQGLNRSGLRVVLFCGENSGKKEPLALIVLEDEIRESVIDTIKYFRENDVSVKVISGDSPTTVSAIAKKCGISGYDRYVSLEGIPDDRIYDMIDDFTIFARVTPDQKKTLVDALQRKGHKVCMTGDGINDIVAMQKAEASVSFKNATDVTKSIADIVLIDNDFSHMKDVVMEGRRSINNMERIASIFLMKSFFTILYQIFGILAGSITIQSEFYGLMEGFAIALAGVLLSFEGNYSKFKGNFMTHVLTQAIPAAFFLLISVLSVYAMELIPNGSGGTLVASGSPQMKVILTLMFTIAAFAILFKQCCPLNKYRAFTFFFSLFCAIVTMVVMPHIYLLWESVGFTKVDGNLNTYIDVWSYFQDMLALFIPTNQYHVEASMFFADSGWWFVQNYKLMIILLVYSCISIPLYFLFYVLVGYISKRFKKNILDIDDPQDAKKDT